MGTERSIYNAPTLVLVVDITRITRLGTDRKFFLWIGNTRWTDALGMFLDFGKLSFMKDDRVTLEYTDVTQWDGRKRLRARFSAFPLTIDIGRVD